MARRRARARKKGEEQLFLNLARSASAGDTGAPVHRSLKETCAIHGKALEEKHAMEAAFPGEVLRNFTRLIWECFSRKSGYADFYRAIWVVDKCGLPGTMYDTCLGMLPEPTESKGQVMHEVSCCSRLKYRQPHAARLCLLQSRAARGAPLLQSRAGRLCFRLGWPTGPATRT
jgi:hypothetical protein